MAIPGRLMELEAADIQAAFDKARTQGKEFVVISACRAGADAWAPSGMGHMGMVPRIHMEEFAVAVGKDSCKEDLKEIFARRSPHSSLYIKRVYAVETEAEVDKNILPVDLDVLDRQMKWDALPWIVRLFSQRPEV